VRLGSKDLLVLRNVGDLLTEVRKHVPGP
jgi:hypothetical protein